MLFSSGSHLLQPVSLGWGITNKQWPEHARVHAAPLPAHSANASPQASPSSPLPPSPKALPTYTAHSRPSTRFSRPPPLSLPFGTQAGQAYLRQTPKSHVSTSRQTTTPTQQRAHVAIPQRSATCGKTHTSGTQLRSRSPMGLHVGTLVAPRPSLPLGAANVPAHIAADGDAETAHAGGGRTALMNERSVSRAQSSTSHERQNTQAGPDGHVDVPPASVKDEESPRDTVWKRLFANKPKEDLLHALTCPRPKRQVAQTPNASPSPRDVALNAGASRFFSQGCSLPSDLDVTFKKPSSHDPTSPNFQLRSIDNISGATRSTYAQMSPFRSHRAEPPSATTPTSISREQRVPPLHSQQTLRGSPAVHQRRDSRAEDTGLHSTRAASLQLRVPPHQQQAPLTPQQTQAREAYPPSPDEFALQAESSANAPHITQMGNQHGKPNVYVAEQENDSNTGNVDASNGFSNANGTKPSAMHVTRNHGNGIVRSSNSYADRAQYADLNYDAPADDLMSKIKELQLAKDEHRRVSGLGTRDLAPDAAQPHPSMMPTSDAPTTYVSYRHGPESPRTPTSALNGAVHQPDPPLTSSNTSQHHYALASGPFSPSSTHSSVAHHALQPTQLLQPSTTGNAYDQHQEQQDQHQQHEQQQPAPDNLRYHQRQLPQQKNQQQQRRQPQQQQQRAVGMEQRLAAPPPVANSRQQRQTLESRNSVGSDSRSSHGQRSSLSAADTRAKLLKDAQRSRPLRELTLDITRHRIRELRSFQRPHALVQKVVRMFVSVVTNRDATLEDWGSLKRTLGGAAFLDSVSQLDVKRLSPMICEVLHDYCEQGVFDPNTLFDVAPSIIPFAQWCEAVAKLNSALATQNEQHAQQMQQIEQQATHVPQNGLRHMQQQDAHHATQHHAEQDAHYTTQHNAQQDMQHTTLHQTQQDMPSATPHDMTQDARFATQHELQQDAHHATPHHTQNAEAPTQSVMDQNTWYGIENSTDGFYGEELADALSEPDAFDPSFLITPEIENLSEDELANVLLTVSVPSVGKIVFAEPVDLRGWTRHDIRRTIQLNIGEVIVYPDVHDKPPPGVGLNRQATISLYQCYPPKQQDYTSSDARARYESKIKRMTEQKGARFISYNADDGEWVFAVDNF